MTEHTNQINLTELANCRLSSIGKPVVILLALAVGGIAAAWIGCQFVDDAGHKFFQAYLVAFAFVLSISLGSLFFVLIQHLMRAGWAVVVRRLAEIFCLNLLMVGILFLPIAWSVWQGDGMVYSWSKKHDAQSESHGHAFDSDDSNVKLVSHLMAQEPSVEHGHIEHSEGHLPTKPYLNNTRFLVTWVVLFAIWIALAVFYFRTSTAQDKTSDHKSTLRMEWWSGIATILFGFSLTFGAFDLLMSLDPAWFSTIFGVYYFAGCVVSGLATLLLVVLTFNKLKLVPNVFSEELQRDLGRLLFAFVFFWAYIGFSQYMLLWYANMPETTGWLVKRGMSTATGYTNSWGWLAIFLLLAHFILPFCGFMSRHVKSNSKAMMFWAVWLLIVHYLDLYWIVIPQSNDGMTISFIEIGTVVSVVAVYGMSALWIASRTNLFAVGDPRMSESLTRHAMY